MKDLPTISQFQVFKNRKTILKNPLPFHRANFEKYGDIFRVRVGFRKAVIFTRDATIIKHILQKQHKKYEKSELQTVDLAKYIGHGILTSNGEHWRKHRRMVQPAFHKKKLRGLLGIMKQAVDSELKRIEPGVTQDVFPLMGDLAFQVVAQALFSRYDIQQSMEELQDYTERNQKMLIREMRQPYLKWWFILSGKIKKHLDLAEQGKIKKHLDLAEQGRNILNSIIEERITSGEQKDDLLDMLLNATYEDGKHMPRRQLIDEVLILFTAGHETTANALSFALHLLAKHPDIQNKVLKEVENTDLDSDDIMQCLSELTYTKQCIEEALRLYPPAYVIDRTAISDDIVKGQSFTKGSLVLMSIYELHRSSAFWDAPEEFNPDRFDISLKRDYSNYYYPFGAGPRMCVGNNFAMYEMIITIAQIIKKFQISTDLKAVEVNPLISLKPMSVPVCFELR
ncbi:cytochrome P450 [uncultured Eudoraea sp.]|uniref:cytochrome P450 n=1 Tax=uncultured Eudoraea sp. TaxID=1035614 RepID=UPI00262B7298|nr:cytochrome P450 [uncultured Eudoraea sp.]